MGRRAPAAVAILVAAAALLTWPTSVLTDEGAPTTFFEAIDVHVVNVDVVVTDRDGRPVHGLTAEDFELLEDGEPVPISNFYAVADGRTVADDDGPGGGASGAVGTGELPTFDDRGRLQLIVFIDNQNITPASRNRLLDDLRTFLSEELRLEDRVMVVSSDPELTLRQELTGAPLAVLGALSEVAEASARSGMSARDYQRILRDMARAGDNPNNQSAEDDQDAIRNAARIILGDIRSYAQNRHRETLASVEALGDCIRLLGAVPGRKALLYVGEGLQQRPGEALFLAWKESFEQRLGNTDIFFSSGAEVLGLEASREIENLAVEANANRVTIYAIGADSPLRQPAALTQRTIGVRSRAAATSGHEALAVASLKASLTALTAPTGGAAAHGDLPHLLARMHDELRDYYSLAYRPPRRRDERRHRVQVGLRDPTLELRYREVYRDKSDRQHMTDRTRTALFLDASNPLDIGIDFGAHSVDEEGRHRLPVIVKVPLSRLTLLPYERHHEGRLSIFVGVRDSRGRLSPIQAQEVPVRVANDRLLASLGQLRGFSMTLVLRPDEHTVAVGVRDEVGHVEATTRARYRPFAATGDAP